MPQVKTVKLDIDAKDAVKGIDQVEKGVKGVDTSAKGAKTGLTGMVGAAKGLGVAFKALGIGLIISAFMKLKDIFSGNIETARMFERVASRLSAAFDVIRDRAEDFIKSLIKLKNPLKAFKEAFTGATAEIKEESAAMAALVKTLQDVRDEERDLMLERSKANKIIAESRLLAEDDTKTMQERLIALKTAVAEEKRVADLELETQQKKVNALQDIIDLGKSSEEDIQKLAEERARFIELQTASTLRQKRVAAQVGVFTAKIDKEKTDAIKEQIALEEQLAIAKEKGFEVTEDLSSKEVKALIKKNEELLKKEQEYQAKKTKAITGARTAIANVVGKETATGKSLATASAIIDTFVAANKALAQGGILGIASAAGIIATGLANVKTIQGTEIPGESGGGDVSVSSTQTPISEIGGVGGNLIPNMETIIPGGANGIQPVQAFVVESDISDSQALQEELDIQATL